jgi:long-chain acyl-CoA synthetase
MHEVNRNKVFSMSIAPVGMSRQTALAQLTAPGQPYELETILAHGREIRAFKNAPVSLRAMYEAAACDKPFIVFENERLSFNEVWAIAAKIGHVMVTQYGIQKGDRVAISMRNYPEWMIAFSAITSIGAIAVAMNALWLAEEMAYGLSDSGAKLLFADQERLDRLAQCSAPPDMQVIAVRSNLDKAGLNNAAGNEAHGNTATKRKYASWDSLVSGLGPIAMPPVDIQPDDPAKILYTSGSTGHPKGVVTSHRNALSALLSWELDAKAGELMTGMTAPEPVEQPASLLAVPLFHVTGLNAVYLISYRLQRRVVSMYKWVPEQAAALIERERISSFVAPAAMTGDLVRTARDTQQSLATLMSVGGGGAPRAPEQVKQIDAVFANAMPNTGWGMTETCAIGTGIGGPEYLQRPASSGRCSAVLDLSIVDESGQPVEAGERGELLVRGASVFKGYWNRPQVNAEVFTGDWFHTGDVAYLDDEGYLFIVDRIKDLIIRGGENIGCGKVESVLLMHPLVHEVSVYSVPDERLGEEIGATVHGDSRLDLEDLREFLRQHLARFEVPRYLIWSAEALPRTPSGKILRREIRGEALKQLAIAS